MTQPHSFPVMLNTVIITKENDYLKIEFKQINVFVKRQQIVIIKLITKNTYKI